MVILIFPEGSKKEICRSRKIMQFGNSHEGIQRNIHWMQIFWNYVDIFMKEMQRKIHRRRGNLKSIYFPEGDTKEIRRRRIFFGNSHIP